jgi:hypothetical protein
MVDMKMFQIDSPMPPIALIYDHEFRAITVYKQDGSICNILITSNSIENVSNYVQSLILQNSTEENEDGNETPDEEERDQIERDDSKYRLMIFGVAESRHNIYHQLIYTVKDIFDMKHSTKNAEQSFLLKLNTSNLGRTVHTESFEYLYKQIKRVLYGDLAVWSIWDICVYLRERLAEEEEETAWVWRVIDEIKGESEHQVKGRKMVNFIYNLLGDSEYAERISDESRENSLVLMRHYAESSIQTSTRALTWISDQENQEKSMEVTRDQCPICGKEMRYKGIVLLCEDGHSWGMVSVLMTRDLYEGLRVFGDG